MTIDTQTEKLKVYSLLAARDTGGVIRCSREMCEVEDLRQLTIDHTHDNGSFVRHLKSKGGPGYYRYLQKPGKLDDVRLLCANHNQEKELMRRGEGQPQEIDVVPASLQINPKLQGDILQYALELKAAWRCNWSELFTRILCENRDLVRFVRDMHDKLCGDGTGLPHAHTLADTSLAPEVNRFAYLEAPPEAAVAAAEALRVPDPIPDQKPHILRRLFG